MLLNRRLEPRLNITSPMLEILDDSYSLDNGCLFNICSSVDTESSLKEAESNACSKPDLVHSFTSSLLKK